MEDYSIAFHCFAASEPVVAYGAEVGRAVVVETWAEQRRAVADVEGALSSLFPPAGHASFSYRYSLPTVANDVSMY